MTRGTWLAAVVVLGLAAAARTGDEAKGVEAKAAFDKLKTLAGSWDTKGEGHGHSGKIDYKVTGNGSVVMETFFPGTDHEMVSMYHLDGDELLLKHYCAARNQPRIKLDRAKSTPNLLFFAFDGGTNFDPAKDMHVHSGQIAFKGPGKVEAMWDAYAGGTKAMSGTFAMSRP